MNRSSSSSATTSGPDLICKVKYLNNLPDIPFDPKFLSYPFDANRFIKYNSSTLEKNFKWDILNEQDLGVRIDLINPETYRIDTNAIIDEADEKLLEEETINQADIKRSEQHNKSVAWLRRNEYISTENTRFQPKIYDQAESKIGYSIKRKLSQIDFYKDRDSQIKAIEKSFEAAKQPIDKHFSKQGVFAVQELPIFPDFDLWRHSCAQVIFDSDPAPKDDRLSLIEQMSQAMIRGMIDESGEQFVAYFLPLEETIAKRRRDAENNVNYEPDEEYHYKLIREYTWSLKTKINTGYEENYYLLMKDDGVFYNQLETRVRLSKRRSKNGKVANSRLVVKHREPNESELKQQRRRLKELEVVDENDDDDDDNDDEIKDSNKEDDQHGNETNNSPDESQNEAEDEENEHETEEKEESENDEDEDDVAVDNSSND